MIVTDEDKMAYCYPSRYQFRHHSAVNSCSSLSGFFTICQSGKQERKGREFSVVSVEIEEGEGGKTVEQEKREGKRGKNLV